MPHPLGQTTPLPLAPDYTALVLGHALLPQPDATYMQEVIDTYVDPTSPFSGEPTYNIVGSPVSVFTPETDYDSGLTQGVTDLDQAITQQLNQGNDNLVIVGYSMSTSVETQELINLASAAGGAPDTDGLKFVLAEDLNNPDGGIFTRLPGIVRGHPSGDPGGHPVHHRHLHHRIQRGVRLPAVRQQHLADLNASDGYVDLHPYLLTGWPAYFNPDELAGAVQDPNVSSADVATELLPAFPPRICRCWTGCAALPARTSAYADLIQPDMRVLVDLGYNWTGDADVDTPATWTSPDIDTTAVDSYLAAGADQGMIAALVDLGNLAAKRSGGSVGSLSVRAGCLGPAVRRPHERRHGGVRRDGVAQRAHRRSGQLVEPVRERTQRLFAQAWQRNSPTSSRALSASSPSDTQPIR